MRWIYLSPHLDDSVFSAGGWIYDQTRGGTRVEIWTLMSGYAPEQAVSSFAESLHTQWGFSSAEESTRMRRQEDENAAAMLGAATRHFDFLDCIYRQDSEGKWLYLDIYAPPHREDAGIPPQIAEAVSAHLQPDDILVCQLAVGSHVDHVLVRQAAELLGRPLRYAIDIPYILYHPESLGAKTAGMREFIHPISKTGLERWKKASLAYESQISTLGDAFDTPDKVRECIQAYWEERKGISFFKPG